MAKIQYYLGNITGYLNVTADNIVEIGTLDMLTGITLEYGGITYDINDLPYPVSEDNNDFYIGVNFDVISNAFVNFEGAVDGTIKLSGSDISILSNDDLSLDLLAATGDVNIETTGNVEDARDDDDSNIDADNLTIVSNNTGSDSNYLNVRLNNLLNIHNSNYIYLTELLGDLNAEDIISDNTSIYLNVPSGNAYIEYISAPGDIVVNAGATIIDIQTIDPTNISLTTGSDGSSIHVASGIASGLISLIGENINVNFNNTNTTNPLTFSATGSNNKASTSVSITANSSNGITFNSLNATNATINNLIPHTAVVLNNTIVSENLTISSDIVTPNTSVIVNNLVVNPITITPDEPTPPVNNNPDNNTPDIINPNNTINNNSTNPIFIASLDNGTQDSPVSLIFISNLPDGSEINSTVGSDINQVINNTENTEFTDEGNQGTKANSSSGDDESFVEFLDPDLYLSDEYSNVTLYLLDRATKIFKEELSSNQSNEEALKKAIAILTKAHSNSEVAQKLLKKEPIASNQSYSMILNALININLATKINN